MDPSGIELEPVTPPPRTLKGLLDSNDTYYGVDCWAGDDSSQSQPCFFASQDRSCLRLCGLCGSIIHESGTGVFSFLFWGNWSPLLIAVRLVVYVLTKGVIGDVRHCDCCEVCS